MTNRWPLLTLFTLLLTTFSLSAAQEDPTPPHLTLERAVQLAATTGAAVMNAQAELQNAETELALALADPLAVRMDQLQAEHAVAAAQEALRNSLITAQITVTTMFTTVLEAELELTAAALRHDIARTTMEAQELRYDAGVITELDLERARNELREAASTVNSARTALDLAVAQLQRTIGSEVTTLLAVTEESVSEPVSSLEQLTERGLQENANLAAARRSVELATAQLAATDNAFNSRQAISAAQAALDSAVQREAELRRNLGLTIQSSLNAVQAAQSRYASADAALITAEAELEAQTARFEAGTVSLLANKQAELQHAGAAANRTSALHELLLAQLRLEQAVLGQ